MKKEEGSVMGAQLCLLSLQEKMRVALEPFGTFIFGRWGHEMFLYRTGSPEIHQNKRRGQARWGFSAMSRVGIPAERTSSHM